MIKLNFKKLNFRKIVIITLILMILALTGCSVSTPPENLREDINQIAQYKREKGIDTVTTNTWQNITFDTKLSNETTEGYYLINNNDTIQVNFSGIVKTQGKVTIINNATNTETQKIAMRIMINDGENRFTQISSNTQRGAGNFNTIPIIGLTRVEKGDIINVQYQVDDTDLDIWGDSDFNKLVALSLNLEKVSS